MSFEVNSESEMASDVINIHSSATGPVALLSNFALTPFELDGMRCASVEGFLQGLKEDKPEKQQRIFAKHGFEAKRAGTRERTNRAWSTKCVYWQGLKVEYLSEQYFRLVESALRAKFAQNNDALQALISTGQATLTHVTDKPESPKTSLPASRFIEMLTRIRAECRSSNADR